jgi:hypothetical protein
VCVRGRERIENVEDKLLLLRFQGLLETKFKKKKKIYENERESEGTMGHWLETFVLVCNLPATCLNLPKSAANLKLLIME